MSEWKPGDVAIIPFSAGEERGMWLGDSWAVTGGRAQSSNYATRRPLVVIDPDSDDDLSRLWRLLPDNLVSADQLQAALREFANPTPPKPDEPTGDGAVVEDASGYRWVRIAGNAVGSPPWRHRGHTARWWEHVTAVRVLSEGVQS